MLHRLLEQSEEKQATSLRTAAIESESELVEIVVEMVGIRHHGGCPATSDQASGHAMHSWHDDVGRVATGGNGSRLVVIALVRQNCRLTSHRFGRSRQAPRLFGQTGSGSSQPHPRRGSFGSAVPRPRSCNADRLALSRHRFPPQSPRHGAPQLVQRSCSDPVLLVGHGPQPKPMAFECPRRPAVTDV